MISDSELAASKEIHRRTGRTFYVATRALPRRMREATYVLYAFFRTADDVVDDVDGPPPEQMREELERIRNAALGECPTDDPVLSAMDRLRRQRGIDPEEIEVFIDAMLMDVDADDYETRPELRDYLRGSSVAVAHMMLTVMDPDEAEAARPHAAALGEAFQMTNFLRDVREDIVDYDRLYLPQATLDRHGVTREQIERLEFSEGFGRALEDELRWTEECYRTGVSGIHYLPEDTQFAILLAAVLYADHHRQIRNRGFDVLSDRPTLSMRRRLWLAARTWLHWQRTDDPERVFYRVGSVPERSDGRDQASRETSVPGTLDRLAGLAALVKPW